MESQSPRNKSQSPTTTINSPSFPQDSETPSPRPSHRMHQPFGKTNSVLFGGQFMNDDADVLSSRRSCLRSKTKEMTGSGIFTDGDNGSPEAAGRSSRAQNKTSGQPEAAGRSSRAQNKTSGQPEAAGRSSRDQNKTSGHSCQQISNRSSQISFNSKEIVSSEKLTSVSEAEGKMNMHQPDTKCEKLRRDGISSPIPEIPPQPLNPVEIPRESSKEVQSTNLEERSVNDIFKGAPHPGSADRQLSTNIILDGKAAFKDYSRGSRQPPGGDSSISLG
ncbi:hypothetical protein GIB67_025991 [Kingdonia uniflora]|uniref:DUF4057 domain-containing protein n=1 Tax=Kingdonia uniflora TaxID=39325 RepID=A0A7J7M2M4_9MAGN|nr:hypothetical protein GIB67_025991 [Kingdonia uniflora]